MTAARVVTRPPLSGGGLLVGPVPFAVVSFGPVPFAVVSLLGPVPFAVVSFFARSLALAP